MADGSSNGGGRMETRLEMEDLVVVVVYFVLIIGVGLYASCRAARGTVSGYFLAGRNMNFVMVGASLFVSNIGSEHFIGLSGSGAAGGIGVGAWELNAILLLQLLGFVFVPVYMACQCYTMPEYLHKRFGGQRIRVYFAVLSLILYIFTKCSVRGLTAVIYTDTLQALLMVVGALILMVKGFIHVGGFEGLWRKYPYAMTNVTVANETCHYTNRHWYIMLREPNDPEMPWPGFLLGQTPGSIWYWCSDQVIVQRALAARSLSHAQASTIMAGFIKILPLFIMVMPGMISRVMYPNEVACVDPQECYAICQSYAGCSSIAYPKLVLGLMGKGLRGLMMAVMIAALMSDLDSIFNSASSLFTIDIWKRMRKRASVREQMVVGRVFIVVMIGVAIAWVPIVKETQGGQVFIYIQEVTNYLAPPVACVFLLALLWPRCNEQGCFWGLMAGFVTGVTRLILVFVYPSPGHCGAPDTRPALIKNVHYMYFVIILFGVTFIVTVIVSMFTDQPSYKQLYRTTFWTRHDSHDRKEVESGKVRAVWGGNCTYDVVMDAATFDNLAADLDGAEDDADVRKTTGGGLQADGTEPQPVVCTVIHTDRDAPAVEEVDTSPNTTTDATKRKRSAKEFCINWLCGVSMQSAENEAADEKAREREDRLSSLKQDPMAKAALYTLCAVILAIGVALYCFWSLWKYNPEGDVWAHFQTQ